MNKFEVHEKEWDKLVSYVEKGNKISLHHKLSVEKIHRDILVLEGWYDNLFCFPIKNPKIFNNIKSSSNIQIQAGMMSDNPALGLYYKEEHRTFILSYGITSKDDIDNIKDIKRWLLKQLI